MAGDIPCTSAGKIKADCSDILLFGQFDGLGEAVDV